MGALRDRASRKCCADDPVMTFELPDDPDEFVKFWLRGNIENGRLAFPKRDPEADAFLDNLNLKIRPDGTYDVSLKESVALVTEALGSRAIQKYAQHVAATNLMHNGPLPSPLKWFAALCLRDLQIGRQGRTRADNFERDRSIIFIVDALVAEKKFSLRATRNEASSTVSACDIVSRVFTELGEELTFVRVTDIYRSKQRRKEINALDPKLELVRAMVEGRKRRKK